MDPIPTDLVPQYPDGPRKRKPRRCRIRRRRLQLHDYGIAGVAVLYAALAVVMARNHGPLCEEAVLYAALSVWHLLLLAGIIFHFPRRRGVW